MYTRKYLFDYLYLRVPRSVLLHLTLWSSQRIRKQHA